MLSAARPDYCPTPGGSWEADVELAAYYPYKSEAVRDACFDYFDKLAAKQWPIAGETRMVRTEFGETFVRIGGPEGAPPLVLLHGAGSTSLMWSPNIEALSTEHRTYAIDQMGEFGRSTCTKPPLSVEDQMRWLAVLFDGLGLRRGVNVAGLSYGGALAAQCALYFPDRLNKAVLLAPGNTVLRLSARAIAVLALSMINKRRGLPVMLRWMFADMLRKDPKWGDETLELLRWSLSSLQRHRPVFPPVLTDAEWGSLKVSTLFLVGEHEVIYPARKAVERLRRVAPLVKAEIIPGAGHDLTFVQAELVNRKMLEFFRPEAADHRQRGAA